MPGHVQQDHYELNRQQRRYYRKKQAYGRCPWSDSKTWRFQKAGKLPLPITNLGGKLPIYDADEWDAALDALIAEFAAADLHPDTLAKARRTQQEQQAERARNNAAT